MFLSSDNHVIEVVSVLQYMIHKENVHLPINQ